MEIKMNNELRYIAYCRRSSEDGVEKQALSIGAQIDEIKARFKGLNIVRYIEESHSAFDIGRPQFDEMVADIRAGKANAIVCWHPDRIARNAVDGGTIIDLLDKKLLKDLKFCAYTFNEGAEGKMMLGIMFTQSKYFSDKLSKDVHRGMKKKASDGWWPGVAPIGYLNSRVEEKGRQRVNPDPERFDLVRRLWDHMLTGVYTVPRLQQIADQEWHLKSLQRNQIGGTPISRAGLYSIFTNPFFYGVFNWNGETYQGHHQPMITVDEFDKVQEILGRKGKPRPKTHHFAYTGMIRCGECQSMVTAEHKQKVLKSTGESKSYTLYHCTKRKKDVACSQHNLNEISLEEQVKARLNEITIPAKFEEWGVEFLDELNETETKDRSQIYKNAEKGYNDIQTQLDRLLSSLAKGLIDEDEYSALKGKLKAERVKFKSTLDNAEQRADKWHEIGLDIFHFAKYAKDRFDNGTLEEKKHIFANLGSNYILKDKIISLDIKKPFIKIAEGMKTIRAAYPRLELEINGSQSHELSNCVAIKQLWLAKWNDFRAKNWATDLKYPELVMKTTEKLLATIS